MCRICYDEEPEGLFTPCKCSGSMRYVHQECLRKWRAVNVRERSFTHCSMCEFEYKLSSSASGPPDSWSYTLARNLATNECAVTATILSLSVALLGEAVEQSGLAQTLVRAFPLLARLQFGPAPTRRRPGPWLPGKAPAEEGEWGILVRVAAGRIKSNPTGAQGSDANANVSPVAGLSPLDFLNLLDVEEVCEDGGSGCLVSGVRLGLGEGGWDGADGCRRGSREGILC
jgi:hypothetical protein